MSTSDNQSNEFTFIGCLFTFSKPNGFVEVIVKSRAPGVFHLKKPNLYFASDADIKECQVNMLKQQFDEPTVFSVLYDSNMNGKPQCPYLVLKIINETKLKNMERKDYVAVTKAVEHVLHKVRDQHKEH
ncbi:hypothetical protein F4604DRAFT_1673756 [Suillus subluteus]|nr:hypothetical protein F4604DRAFT_1673756 [Suillus subluteus]